MSQRARAISATCIVSFVILLIILPIFIVGFASPDWLHLHPDDDDTIRVGLWQVCQSTDGERTCQSIELGEQDAWFIAVVSLMTCSLMTAVIGAATAMFLPITAGVQMLAGMLGIIGVIVYAAEAGHSWTTVPWNLQWAYYMSAVATVGLLLNGCVFLILSFMTDWRLSFHNPCNRHHRHVHPDDGNHQHHHHHHHHRQRTKSEIEKHIASLPKRTHRVTIGDFRRPDDQPNNANKGNMKLEQLAENPENTSTANPV